MIPYILAQKYRYPISKPLLEKHNKTQFSDREFSSILNHLDQGNVFDRAKRVRDKKRLKEKYLDVCDRTVNIADIEKLYGNINAAKNIVAFVDAGHELLVKADLQLWQENVGSFLDKLR